jgi:hypothetical protein
MRVGNFCLLIPEGRERDSGHVELAHGRQYTLRLTNQWYDRRCDADLSVDGKPVGCFRLHAGETMALERPSHDTGRFTFYRAGTVEAGQAGEANVGAADRGLVRVRFTPERRRERKADTGGILRSMSVRPMSMDPGYWGGTTETSIADGASCGIPMGAAAGVTGLSGHSGQTFTTVGPLDYDATEEVVITLRLVAPVDGRTGRRRVGGAGGGRGVRVREGEVMPGRPQRGVLPALAAGAGLAVALAVAAAVTLSR